ncbi:MAG: hypothetical protein ACJ74O_07640 [Frankiaceae bacterium]
MSPSPARLRAHGLGVSPPPGWDAHIYRRAGDGDGSVAHPVLHAATVPLPRSRGDYGTGAVELLGPHDVLVALVEHGDAAAGTALFARAGLPRPAVADFDPRGLQRTIDGQSGAQWFFHVGRRAFCLYVVLGSHAARARLIPRVRQLVDALVIE